MRQNKKVAFLLAASLCLGGCSADPGQVQTGQGTESKEDAIESAYTASDDLIVVGVSQVGSESVWRTANTESLQKTFTQDNGYFLLFDNARQKQENQIKALRSFISQRVDYIVLSPLTEEGWDTVFEEARDAGIPIILIDRQADVADDSLYTAWVGSDFHWEGQQAGEILQETLQKKGRENDTVRIVTLCGTEGGTATIGRTEGFAEVAATHENWIMLDAADADFTTTKGKEVMHDMLQRYKDIDVVISQNDDMTFGALDALQEAGLTTGPDGDVQVISFDATPNGLALVRDGQITADVECNPQLGEYVDRIIKNLESGTKVQKEQYVQEMVYTKENVTDVEGVSSRG